MDCLAKLREAQNKIIELKKRNCGSVSLEEERQRIVDYVEKIVFDIERDVLDLESEIKLVEKVLENLSSV